MSEERIHPISGKKQRKIAPEGLPVIWVDISLCDRCKIYNECLGFGGIEDKDWAKLNVFINTINSSTSKIAGYICPQTLWDF